MTAAERAQVARYAAAVELENARDTRRIAARAGRVTVADQLRCEAADAAWTACRGGEAA